MNGKDSMVVACLLGASAVIIGAFGSHALKEIMTVKELANFNTGSQYHFYHALATLFAGYYYHRTNKRITQMAIYFFVTGVLFFSGSLYLYATLQGSWMVYITPIGGLMLIIGWVLLGISTLTKPPKNKTKEA